MDRKERIGKIIDEVIGLFIRDFLEYPYDYTLERDIHGQFYHKLLSHEDSYVFKKPYMLLHLEYPHDKPIGDNRNRGNVDLVVLKAEESKYLVGNHGDYNKNIKKIIAMEFEFNDTGQDAIDHFQRDIRKLDDCTGAITYLIIFMRDKTFTYDGNSSKPEYFEKLVKKEEPFDELTINFPNYVYYVNAQTKNGIETYQETINGIRVFTQDERERDILLNI